MADKTLNDVIERMKAEGQLTRNTGTNSIKTVKELVSHMKERDEESAKDASERNQQLAEIKQALLDGDEEAVEVITKSEDNLTTGDDVELLREEVARELEVIELLREIRDNTAGMGQQPQKEEKQEGPGLVDVGLGAIVAGGALGAAAGVVLGQLKAIETLIPPIETLRRKLRILFKRTIPRQFTQLTKSIRGAVRGVLLAATIQFELIRASFLDFGKKFKGLLRPVTGIFAPVVAVVRGIGNYIGRIAKTFTGAFDEIVKVFRAAKNFSTGTTAVGKALKPIQDGIRAVVGFFKGIGGVFSTVMKSVAKIFAPIAIVLTVVDTFKGAVEGFTKTEGSMLDKIIGGLKGGIKGFVNSLIGLPLDLLKNGIAWLMGKFGVDPEKVEAVRNFSFVESFNKIIDGLFAFPSKAIDWLTTKFSELSEKVGQIITNIMGDPIGFVSKILAAPYTLLQKGIAWILGKFGFENASEEVASFDIAGEISKVINRVVDFFKGVIDFYVGMFKGGAELVGNIFSGDFDAVKDTLKRILRSILPVPDPNGNWYDPANLASKAIPKAIYDFAGIDKETGEMLELPQPEITVPDPTPIRTEIDTAQLQEDVDRNRPKVEFDTEQPVVVDGSQTEIDTPAMTNREAQQMQLEQENRQREERVAQNSGGAPIVIGGSSANVTNNNSSSSTTVGLTGTSGDPNDRYWGG